MDGQLRELLWRKGRARHIVGDAVNAILAVIDAGVAHEHLEQRDAPAVRGKAVAEPTGGGVTDPIALRGRTVDPAARTCGVVFRGIGKNA